MMIALLALVLLAPLAHAHPTIGAPSTTMGDDRQLQEIVEDEAERAVGELDEFARAYLRNFRECMLQENPECGL